MTIDFGKTAQDYGRYRAGFPESFFERLRALGIGQPGQRALDLGTGAGNVARGLARAGCAVTGLDPSSALLLEARRLDWEAGLGVRQVRAVAEALPFPAGAFEVATAGQCWH